MQRCFRAYSLLAAIWSPLFLAASNASEWIRIRDLLWPVAISVAAAAVAWLIAALLTSDPDRRAFVAFVGVLAFVGYGTLSRTFSWVPAFARIGPSAISLITLGLGVWYAVLRVRRTAASFAGVSRFFGSMTALLVLFALVPFVRLRLVRAPEVVHAPVSATAVGGDRPAIYLIIPDEYSGTRSLRSLYGFDNTPFEDSLRARGFVLPHIRANYTSTRPAMASMLNWTYLDSLIAQVGTESQDSRPMFQMVDDNRAMRFLKSLGYETVFLPSGFQPLDRIHAADRHVPDPSIIAPEFLTVWHRTTLLAPLAEVACRVLPCWTQLWTPEATGLVDWKFARLGELAAPRRFVLAHFMVPHEPYVYRADCRHTPFRDFWPDSATMRTAYTAQIECVNQKLLSAIDSILARSATTPVILIQSDHGEGHPPKGIHLAQASSPVVRARVDAFAAYLVPGMPDTLFYDGMTPVNLLPMVFNHLFGTTFPRLPDRTFWGTYEAPYRMTPVPGELLGVD